MSWWWRKWLYEWTPDYWEHDDFTLQMYHGWIIIVTCTPIVGRVSAIWIRNYKFCDYLLWSYSWNLDFKSCGSANANANSKPDSLFFYNSWLFLYVAPDHFHCVKLCAELIRTYLILTVESSKSSICQNGILVWNVFSCTKSKITCVFKKLCLQNIQSGTNWLVTGCHSHNCSLFSAHPSFPFTVDL